VVTSPGGVNRKGKKGFPVPAPTNPPKRVAFSMRQKEKKTLHSVLDGHPHPNRRRDLLPGAFVPRTHTIFLLQEGTQSPGGFLILSEAEGDLSSPSGISESGS